MDTDMSYAKAVAELEEIVAKMQSENCDIDLLADYTSRALELLQFCRAKLRKTDEDVRKCLETLSNQSL